MVALWPVRPNMRSFTIGSTPFHSAKARHRSCRMSDRPAIRLRSTCTREIAHDHVGRSSRHHRCRCSPRVRCPRRARRDTGPTRTRGSLRRGVLRPSRCLSEPGMLSGVVSDGVDDAVMVMISPGMASAPMKAQSLKRRSGHHPRRGDLTRPRPFSRSGNAGRSSLPGQGCARRQKSVVEANSRRILGDLGFP